VVVFSIQQEVNELSSIDALEGKLSMQLVEDKLMHSILQSDKKTVDHAELLQESANQNIGAFTPDMLYSRFVNKFSVVEQLMGPKLVRLLTGYSSDYIEKNINIPEFQRELKQQLEENINDLKKEKLLDKDGRITDKGTELSSLLLLKHLDQYQTKDATGEKHSKTTSHYGERTHTRPYRKGDRYKDIHLRRTIRRAIRRGHTTIEPEDLIVSVREGKGTISIIYALDASSSMKGDKISACKKAGVSLAHNAIKEKDKVGLVVFGSEVTTAIEPTTDFGRILTHINAIRPARQTDFTRMINKSIELFPPGAETKHLVIITDAAPTVGKDPEKATINSVSQARACGITISIIGINLDEKSTNLAREITSIGSGRLTIVKHLDELGNVVLQDYRTLSA